jgi:hypothetical protein
MLPDLKVFISSSAEDIPVAEQVAKALANYGIDSFISGERSGLHTDLEIEVRREMEASYAFLLIVSATSLQSETVKHEMDLATEKNRARKLVGLSVDGTEKFAYKGSPSTFLQGSLDTEFVDNVSDLLYRMRPVTWLDSSEPPVVNFSAEVSPDQLKGVLSALSNYWRSCGGIGLVVETLGEEIQVAEPINA